MVKLGALGTHSRGGRKRGRRMGSHTVLRQYTVFIGGRGAWGVTMVKIVRS